MKHIKTTEFHPQLNGNIERMHSTLLSLIKTSMEGNENDWDENMKLINFAINRMKNQTTGLTPFEITFGREPNIPSTIANSPTLTYQDLIRKWKTKTRKLYQKGKRKNTIGNRKNEKKIRRRNCKKAPFI